MNEIKNRKNSFGKGSSVNTDLPAFNCPHVYIVHSKRGGDRKQTIFTWYRNRSSILQLVISCQSLLKKQE